MIKKMSHSEKKRKDSILHHNKKRTIETKSAKVSLDGSSGKEHVTSSKHPSTVVTTGSASSTYGAHTIVGVSHSFYAHDQKTSGPPDLDKDGAWAQFLTQKAYKIVDKVGAGNYANVYRVRTASNKEMAVKIIDVNKVSKRYKTRFLPRELNILSKIRHKNIVEIYSIQKSASFIFFFMEYTPNGTLGDFIRRNRAMPEWMCKPMFSQIVEAIHYMHSLGIAHRDLKLENILLDKFSNPKLTDFSYAVIFDDVAGHSSLSDTFCGSIPYMPPEILEKRAYDPKLADIWSLGVCIFIMLNDRLPFRFQDIRTMIKLQHNKQYAYKQRIEKTLSSQCKDCVSRMLEPDVKHRITSVGLILHPWLCKI